jgi:hypothetical protein
MNSNQPRKSAGAIQNVWVGGMSVGSEENLKSRGLGCCMILLQFYAGVHTVRRCSAIWGFVANHRFGRQGACAVPGRSFWFVLSLEGMCDWQEHGIPRPAHFFSTLNRFLLRCWLCACMPDWACYPQHTSWLSWEHDIILHNFSNLLG